MNEEIIFQSIYHLIDIPIFIIDITQNNNETCNLVFSGINPSYEKITGLDIEEIMGKSPAEISQLLQTEPGQSISNCQQCLKADKPVGYDEEFQLPGGRHSFFIYLIPIHNLSGEIHRIFGVLYNNSHSPQLEKELNSSKNLIKKILWTNSTPIFGIDLKANVQILWNRAAERNLGWNADELIGQPLPYKKNQKIRGTDRFIEKISQGLAVKGLEISLKKRDGSFSLYNIYTSPLKDSKNQIIGNIAILNEKSPHNRMDKIMQARLRLLELAKSKPMDQLLTATLDELEILTGSSIGFYHFLEPDQKTLSLQNWSTNTLEYMCTAVGKGTHYSVSQAGVWADCVSKRSPLIHNDYILLPNRKGLPEGHAHIARELVVPIFRGNVIKGIIGVGNKPTDYDDIDIEIVSQLADLSWDIIERMQTEDTLKRSEEEKTILNRIANIFLTLPDEAIYEEVLKVVLEVMKSKLGIFGYLEENGDFIAPTMTGEIWDRCQIQGKSMVFTLDSLRESIWGNAIKEKKSFYSEGPFHTPEGHLHIDYFLAVPILYGEEAIGLIAVANKDKGYTEENKQFLEHIARNISPILKARLQRDREEQRRLAAERSLRESEEKYRLLVTNADEAIFIIQDELVKFPNPKAMEMGGYSLEELANIPFTNLIYIEDRDMVARWYQNLLKGQRLTETQPFRILNKMGNVIWVKLASAPIIWEKKPGILCFLKDITMEKKLEAQFMQSQKMEAVGRLAGGVAHDFNNMLVVIMGYAELALDDITPANPLYEQLKMIKNAAQQSANLTRQLLAFARKQTIDPKILNLNETVSGMINMLKRLINEEIELVWKPGTELWAVKMDPSQIDQILANLCVNARDAIFGVGKITIETQNITFDETYCSNHADFIPGEYVMLAMSDSGCGIEEKIMPHLFEPFFTTKELGKGTGLGLATVYGIVKQNNGFINVYSEPGMGTTFSIYFPRHNSISTETISEKKAITPSTGDETVLIVEDEKEILHLGKRILENLGYTVLIARTPVEALHLVQNYSGNIHLLITDVIMPEMNGRELATRLKAIKTSLKCLYMSGYTANTIAHQGILQDGVHFIQKPYSIKELSIKVRQVLEEN